MPMPDDCTCNTKFAGDEQWCGGQLNLDRDRCGGQSNIDSFVFKCNHNGSTCMYGYGTDCVVCNKVECP